MVDCPRRRNSGLLRSLPNPKPHRGFVPSDALRNPIPARLCTTGAKNLRPFAGRAAWASSSARRNPFPGNGFPKTRPAPPPVRRRPGPVETRAVLGVHPIDMFVALGPEAFLEGRKIRLFETLVSALHGHHVVVPATLLQHVST